MLQLPPYALELNPAERIFRHLRAKLANRTFADLTELGNSWEQPTILQQLTGHGWSLASVASIQSSSL